MQRKLFLNKLHLSRALMVAAILLIVLFQAYWISRLYRDEKEGLAKETNSIFRDVVYNLQVDRLKADTLFYRTVNKPNLFVYNVINAMVAKAKEQRRDSVHASQRLDTPPRMIFVGDPKQPLPDSQRKRPRIIISGGSPPPPAEMAAILRKEFGQGSGGAIKDSATLKQIALSLGMDADMIMRSGKDQGDTIMGPVERKNFVFSVPVGKVHKTAPPKTRRETAQVSMSFDGPHPEKTFIRMINDGKTIADSIPVGRIDSAYKKELAKTRIPLGFTIRTGKDDTFHRKDTAAATAFRTRPAIVGLANPHWYQAEFASPDSFLLRKISPQILFSLFLVAFTSVTFIFLYRNLASQRRLTEMKNDFISNITHELKTPIATVSVAVEALRNFGGLQSPERTKEYLDISASELQRLGLLVDKVLKLSLFENRELELKKEPVDLKELTQEVLNTMKLQFEKHHAKLDLEIQGYYFSINADRLHITSVVYNLLDNALKYSKEKPEITVLLKHDTDTVILEVSDKGIGIPAGYTGKIFDKFFRVPTGDHHNIKGYGLGLSYVSHVVQKHGGTISVQSEPGKGSTFTVKLPIA